MRDDNDCGDKRKRGRGSAALQIDGDGVMEVRHHHFYSVSVCCFSCCKHRPKAILIKMENVDDSIFLLENESFVNRAKKKTSISYVN